MSDRTDELATIPAARIVQMARLELATAIGQMLLTDDQIICDRVKTAKALLDTIQSPEAWERKA